MIRPLIASLAILAITSLAQAQDSVDYALKGRAAWSAFGCAALAGVMDDKEANARLFQHGYSQGLEFIKAVQSGKVKRDDISKQTPVGVLWLMQGPTPDFMLGRIYETAADEALKAVYKPDDPLTITEGDRKLRATVAFGDANCALVGAAK